VLRTVAFGDLDAGVWGAAWGAEQPFVTLGALDVGEATAVAPVTIEGSGETEEWRISGEGVELALAPEGSPASTPALNGAPASFDQLCRVRGRFNIGRTERAVDCLGRRGVRVQPIDLGRFESLRDVSAWFGPDQGLVVASLRPRKATGHGADVVTAALLEPTGPVAVADPRLSTTYTAEGRPSRMSLELWLGDEEDEYPRRAAGEAIGAGVTSSRGEVEVRAELLRCHSRGSEGAGVYLLVRAR
jgi:hypothetical protein